MNNTDQPKRLTQKNHLLGVILIIITALIWVFASEFLQYIYEEGSHFEKPFFVTYFSTSFFVVYFVGFLFVAKWKEMLRGDGEVGEGLYVPVTGEDGDQLVSELVTEDDDDDGGGGEEKVVKRYSLKEVIKLGALFTPLFVLSNYTFNLGLKLTSVSSSSTISTLSGLFTLILGAFLHVERFSGIKFIAAVVTIGGVALISKVDRAGEDHRFIGDLFSLSAAVLYACYTTFLKKFIKNDECVDTPMLFAFLGFFTMIGLWPVLILLHYLGIETFEWPSLMTCVYLSINALVGTVLADYLWARSVVLTTPLISTLALSLTVPFSLFADLGLGKERFTTVYIIGVSLVIGGFVLVNVDEALSNTKSAKQSDEEKNLTGDYNAAEDVLNPAPG